MALRENILAAGLPDLTAAKPGKAPVAVNHGALRTSCFTAAILNGDSLNSTFIMGRLPSHARVHRLSALISSGIAGLTDVDLGVADAPACLVDGADLTATGSDPAASATPVGQDGKMLWELAGLTADPKAEMELVLTIKTAATAAGTITADLVYVTE